MIPLAVKMKMPGKRRLNEWGGGGGGGGMCWWNGGGGRRELRTSTTFVATTKIDPEQVRGKKPRQNNAKVAATETKTLGNCHLRGTRGINDPARVYYIH